MKLWIYKTRKYIADLFLPNRCPICRRLIPWNKYVCRECSGRLTAVTDELCPVCAKKECKDHSSLKFDCVVCLFEYADTVKEGIYALKYHNGTNFGEYSAKLLAKALEDRELAKQIDVVTCVPMSRQRLKKRHRNHSAVIGRTLAMFIDKPFDDKLLVHHSSDTVHHHLKAVDRLANATVSFAEYASHKDISGKTVLLCDDVYTTGATLNSCSSLLKNMGAKKVIAVSAATTLLDKEKTGAGSVRDQEAQDS